MKKLFLLLSIALVLSCGSSEDLIGQKWSRSGRVYRIDYISSVESNGVVVWFVGQPNLIFNSWREINFNVGDSIEITGRYWREYGFNKAVDSVRIIR